MLKTQTLASSSADLPTLTPNHAAPPTTTTNPKYHGHKYENPNYNKKSKSNYEWVFVVLGILSLPLFYVMLSHCRNKWCARKSAKVAPATEMGGV